MSKNLFDIQDSMMNLLEYHVNDETGEIVETEEEFNEFCMALPRYKRPKKIILSDIPRNATGKIQKNALRERMQKMHEARKSRFDEDLLDIIDEDDEEKIIAHLDNGNVLLAL